MNTRFTGSDDTSPPQALPRVAGRKTATLSRTLIQARPQTLTSPGPDDKIEEILTIVVKQRSSALNSEKIGHIRIFDVQKSPDTAILRHDTSIKKVFTLYDLREALESPAISIIMIPEGAAIDRLTVSDIAERYSLPKTIFVECAKG